MTPKRVIRGAVGSLVALLQVILCGAATLSNCGDLLKPLPPLSVERLEHMVIV